MSDLEEIQKGIEQLSVYNDYNDIKDWHAINEHWVYGFHLKHRIIRKIARKLRLPWESNPGGVLYTVDEHIGNTSGVPYWATIVYRRGRSSLIATFAKDDGRRRSERIKFTPEAMDRVRRAMRLPRGTKPKWYDTTGKEQDGETELSSDDEEWPNNGILTRTEDTIELIRRAGALDANRNPCLIMADEGVPRSALIEF